MKIITIYVGMGLTQAPEAFRVGFQNELKAGLRELEDIEILDFVGLEGSTEEEVYSHDRNCTMTANLCVFIVDHPSIGLGIEIAFRLATGKPMLVFAKEDAKITRMLTGLCKIEQIQFYRYQEVSDLLRNIDVWLWGKAELEG